VYSGKVGGFMLLPSVRRFLAGEEGKFTICLVTEMLEGLLQLNFDFVKGFYGLFPNNY
jgi:hypothetical protein